MKTSSLLLRNSCSSRGDRYISGEFESSLIKATIQLKRGHFSMTEKEELIRAKGGLRKHLLIANALSEIRRFRINI